MKSYPDFIYNEKNKTVIIEKTGQFIVSSSVKDENGMFIPERFVDIKEIERYLQYYNIEGKIGTKI